LKLEPDKCVIAEPILKEVNRRLDFCIDVGLEYITLDRRSPHFPGGEAERIRLATQVGSGLVGWFMCWMSRRLAYISAITSAYYRACTPCATWAIHLLSLKHDEDTIRKADWVVDLGPGAGRMAGK